MAAPVKEHVKKHLKKNGVEPDALPNSVISALNAFTEEELAKVDRLGDSVQRARLDVSTKISAVH